MEKDKLIKTFDEEISSGISAIQDVEINTDEYGKAVDNDFSKTGYQTYNH